ncbi:hypothetical protein QYM36_007035 [Artemia franciscana]|uniref:DDE-1 domain-containing protein n=1 Tax=Artemia franciscana TaxID=6661 RepID=A0AA88I222_ARTSF|nr:hypothetical protein QYM36_007035 [Artemia franciscana]
MLTGAPANSAGGASPSGWVNQELFLEYLKHFKTYSHASPESPKLLIMDNHESHICSAVVQFAKESGITLLTIPSHCSHRLQPLDICVYFPFKCQYNKAMDNWMLSNPGKTVTIYEIASLVGQSLPIEEQEAERKDKKARGGRARGKVATVGRAGKAKKDQTTKKLFVDSEGSDDEKMILDDDSDDSMKLGELEDDSEKEEEIFDSVSTGDFVKVVYKGEYFPGLSKRKPRTLSE